MFSVQLLARFFSNSDKLIVPAQQTLRVNLATKRFNIVIVTMGMTALVKALEPVCQGAGIW